MADMDEESGKGPAGSGSRGFKVSDRRGQSKDAPKEGGGEEPGPTAPEDDREKAAPRQDAPSSGGEEGPGQAPITFTTFVFSLSSSALVQLGEIADPFTRKVERNLPVAQQTIDLLGMLEEKTQGNLNEEEKKTLEAVLYDLRLRFLKASGRI